MAELETKEAAEGRSAEMMRDIVRMSVPRPDKGSSPEVREYVERHLKAGRNICEFLWIPQSYQPAFLACLKDENAYGSDFGPIGLWVRLQNVSARPLRVIRELRTHVQKVPQQRGDTIAYVPGDTWREEEIAVTVAPGAEIDVSARWAITALLDHCQRGWPPNLWGESSAIPQSVALKQVAVWTSIGIDTRPKDAPERRRAVQREGAVPPG